MSLLNLLLYTYSHRNWFSILCWKCNGLPVSQIVKTILSFGQRTRKVWCTLIKVQNSTSPLNKLLDHMLVCQVTSEWAWGGQRGENLTRKRKALSNENGSKQVRSLYLHTVGTQRIIVEEVKEMSDKYKESGINT